MGVLIKTISADDCRLNEWRSTLGSRDLIGSNENQRLVGKHAPVRARPIDIPLEDLVVEDLNPPARLEMSIRQTDRGEPAGSGGPVSGDDVAQGGAEALGCHAGVFKGIADDE